MPPLEPAVRPDPPIWRRHLAGLLCLGVGAVAMVIAAVMVMMEEALFAANPDPRIAVPLWIGAILLAGVSAARKEGSYGYAVGGVALASAALALGYVLVLAAVAAVALLVIYALTEMF